MKRHEKQFSLVAVSARTSIGSLDKQKETVHSPAVSEVGKKQPGTTHTNNATFHRRYQKALVHCFKCKKVEHYARDCPSSGGKVEAPGQSSAKSAVLTATPVDTESALSSLSNEQLEQQLAQQKLSTKVSEIQSASTDSANVHVVKANSVVSDVVGSTPHLDLLLGDVSVSALIDSGSQSTIISRKLLHKTVRKAHSGGKPLPSLKVPVVKLFGKGGNNDCGQLDITA